MGEANRRREELRSRMISDAEKWTFPASAWEANLVQELLDMPSFDVPRMPADQIEWMRMPANQCHANVRWYVDNDPTQQTRIATGWWVQWPDFMLHSVLENNGQFICITPTPFEESAIRFIPDKKIEWRETGDVYSPFRQGSEIAVGVRRFPEFTIARSRLVTSKLVAGGNPYQAIELSETEMEALKAEFIPQEFH